MTHIENSRDSSPPRVLEAVTFDVTHTLLHAPDLARIYSQVLNRHGLNRHGLTVGTRAVGIRDLAREIPWVWNEMSCGADPRRDRFTSHPKGAQGWWLDFLRRLCQRLDLAEPSRFAAAELYERFARADAWQLYPDVLDTLETLRQRGLRLGVVSNWDERLPRLLERLGLAPFFDVVVTSSSVGVEKPNPRIFRHCLEHLGVEPEHALHVGDAPIDDVEGAMAAGMQAQRIDRREPVRLIELVLPLVRSPAVGPREDRPHLRPVGNQHGSS